VQVCKKQLALEFEIVGVAYDGPISEVRYQHPYVTCWSVLSASEFRPKTIDGRCF
jgi:hypothetical protein